MNSARRDLGALCHQTLSRPCLGVSHQHVEQTVEVPVPMTQEQSSV